VDAVDAADTVHTIRPTPPRQGTTMQTNTKTRNMLECFASATERPVDVVDDIREGR
jgi:hypothetical protein